MAEKEFTCFIVDLSPAMGSVHNARATTDLEHGLQYVKDLLAGKLIRGKKTDIVSVVGVHTKATRNSLSTDEHNVNMALLQSFTHMTYDAYRTLMAGEICRVNADPIRTDAYEANLFKALVYAMQLFIEATPASARDKPDKNLRVKRTIVLTTNLRTELEYDTELLTGVSQLMGQFNVQLIVNCVGLETGAVKAEDHTQQYNQRRWYDLIRDWNHTNKFEKVYDNAGLIADTDTLLRTRLEHPPGRYYKSTKLYTGDLRFAGNVKQLLGSSVGDTADSGSLRFPVEMYPAIRVEKLLSGSLTYLNRGEVRGVKSFREYYYEIPYRADDGDEYKKVPVEEVAIEKGFKYTTTDLIQLSQVLAESLKLPTQQALDIRGFVPQDELQPWYFSANEANYIVPASTSQFRDLMAFNAFVQALIELELYVVARYVQKKLADVSMLVLVPVVFREPPTVGAARHKRELSDDGFPVTAHALLAHRLPFKEDEKIGNFPALTNYGKGLTEHRYTDKFPTKEMQDLMDQYVDSMDMGAETRTEEAVMEPNYNKKSLPLPVKGRGNTVGMARVLREVKPVAYHIAAQTAVFKDIVSNAAASGGPIQEYVESEEAFANLPSSQNLKQLLSIPREKLANNEVLVRAMVEVFDIQIVDRTKSSARTGEGEYIGIVVPDIGEDE
ncbi:hypothetical protein BABINDRAFT_120843 [Babjeviella inositovora NRRL Y-12698]|uniref:DNA helicase n=1 Tax=Babjeviella inositovora NRRL Y-12698 TaxID=984486 RepID=A0A1E3QW11_9ASCO|nr:uncharacterized protein BABINDRAFT_120843 [Babjeviella inositovora NRRL Y-12698]ODQ81167.1 hypothetical protein BABINDRAFT_120843 [Babjeviella inositovora NRRL Y-12698]